MSLELAQQANEVARGLGDERLLALASGVLCLVYYHLGDLEKARLTGQVSVERARRLGDDEMLALALRVYAVAVEPAQAAPLYAEAFACTARSGDIAISCWLHLNAGVAALELNDIAGARVHLEASLVAADEIRLQFPLASVNLGQVLRAQHDPAAARSAFEDAIRICRRIGDKIVLSFAVLGLACLAADVANWHRAAVLHGIAQAIHDPTGLSWQLWNAGRPQESFRRTAEALGQEQFHAAYTHGMTLGFDQAISLAIERTPV